MSEFLSLYGKYIIGGILAVALLGWLMANGLSLVDNAASLTSKSNDYTQTQSEQEMKTIVESELPEVTGTKGVILNTAYLISYDEKNPTLPYLLQTKDAGGKINTSCTVTLLDIKGVDKTVMFQKSMLTTDGATRMSYNEGKLTFLVPGTYKFKVEVSDKNGTTQMTTIAINVGED